ncbi:MAG: sigma-70 family RNA polymerase sigma factor [Bacteroidetes bacterium]|nr:MAG: sigma-70 family RNA polymerase sigma factor [Bacteroidota bacterium]
MATLSGSHISEDQLVDLLKQKDQEGLEYLYDRYAPALFGVILRIVPDEKLAEDALQESFIKIWRKIESYNPQKGRLFTWMLNICRNTAIDTRRSKQFTSSQKSQTLDSSYENQAALSSRMPIEHIGVSEQVKALDAPLREVIDLLYFQGYTQSEAAKALNLPLGTLKTRARTAIRVLRKRLQE